MKQLKSRLIDGMNIFTESRSVYKKLRKHLDAQPVGFPATASGVERRILREVFTADEAKLALDLGAEIIGINNRNLDTLETNIKHTEEIINKVPQLDDKIIVSESGIKTRADVEYLAGLGVESVLVGETLLKSDNITKKVQELLGK